MKNKKFIVAILLLLASVIVLSWVASQKRYNLQLITRFTVPEITLNPNHKVLDGYAVSIALSDSLIYITDASDTTNTKSFCFDYSGKPNSGFNFPSDRGYGEIFVDKNLFYLPQSHLLLYNNWQKQLIDYYTVDGAFIRTDTPFYGMNIHVLGVAEFDNSIFFTTIGSKDSESRNLIETMCLYKELPEKTPIVIKKISLDQEVFKKSVKHRALMIDDNGKDEMAILERYAFNQQVTLFKPSQNLTFNISIPKRFITPTFIENLIQIAYGKKTPYQFVLGKNFVVLGYWKPDLLYPLEHRLYNLKGNHLGKLVFKDAPQNELVDIIGDKLVAFNPANGVVSIYSISLK